MPPRDSDKPAIENDTASEASDTQESDEASSIDEETFEAVSAIYLNNPSLKNARYLALIAEERWLIDKMMAIRRQRNALKVEALTYQGLKADAYAKHAEEFGGETVLPPREPVPIYNDNYVPIPEPTYLGLGSDLDKKFARGLLTAQDMLKKLNQLENKKEISSNLEDFSILEGQCNSEELEDLSVERNEMETWDIEDPEYESEEEEASSRVNIDMSMLVGYDDDDDMNE